jgi:dTDP-4-amino-4,6-dideoxy-D-galactose acyltransferase
MGQQVSASLVAARAAKLFFYSPYNFLRQLAVETQQAMFGTGLASDYASKVNHHVFEFQQGAAQVQFLYAFLPWDSDFFGGPVYKLFTILFTDDTPSDVLAAAGSAFRKMLGQQDATYCFAELPAEDTRVAQALGDAGWRLVETRLTYFRDELLAFDQPRYPVRYARTTEATAVGQVSAAARNEYDRFHADQWFSPDDKGDRFLARYAAAAVEGYCDAVLVPAEPGLPLDSFLAISDLREHAISLGAGFSRVVLTAVGPMNRGWHLKLVSETVHRAREQGAEYVLMTTQATNRAVFRTCEKLNFKVGGCSHVLACSHFH